MKSKNLAVLYFARSPLRDLGRKSFQKKSIDLQLLSRLDSRTRSVLASTGLPVLVSDERTQRGADFAERLTNAITAVFAKGFEQVIVVGNDCPDLQAAHITAAKLHMAQGRNVLGPARDGGDYLIGIHRSGFDPRSFSQSFSDKTRVHGRLRTTLNTAQSAPAELEYLRDIDNFASLKAWLLSDPADTAGRSFRHFIRTIIFSDGQAFRQIISLHTTDFFNSSQHRGPPSMEFGLRQMAA